MRYSTAPRPVGATLFPYTTLFRSVTREGALARITARIGNAGAVPVGPGVKVALYEGTPGNGKTALAVVSTTQERSEEHTSELQSRLHIVCRRLPEKKHRNPHGCST